MSNLIALIGAPGTGKTIMSCTTTPNVPVHVVDLDRKLDTISSLGPLVSSNLVTFDEIDSPFIEDSLTARLTALSKRSGIPKKIDAIARLDELLTKYEKGESKEFNNCKTLVIDSFTMLAAHYEKLIALYSGNIAFQFTEWGALLKMLHETTTVLVDLAKKNDKDLICTFHEKQIDIPTSNTIYKYEGSQRMKGGLVKAGIGAAISGRFGEEFGRYFSEVYSLEITMEGGVPKWKCRVLPDGIHIGLRCSYDTKGKAEFEPNFRKIWGLE